MVRNPLLLSENQIFIYVSEISFPSLGRSRKSNYIKKPSPFNFVIHFMM